jgi:orotate phosphoribosyltransferase
MALYENSRELLLDALARYAYKQAPADRPFRLSSGLSSSIVIDASLVLRHPAMLRALATLLHRHLPIDGAFDVVGGPSSGADPLCAAALAVRNVQWCSVRRATKDHGFDTGLITGPVNTGDRVVVVDDVLTTGASVVRAIQAFKEVGCTVLGVVVLVNREQYGGNEEVRACLAPGAFLRSVVMLHDIESYRSRCQEVV